MITVYDAISIGNDFWINEQRIYHLRPSTFYRRWRWCWWWWQVLDKCEAIRKKYGSCNHRKNKQKKAKRADISCIWANFIKNILAIVDAVAAIICWKTFWAHTWDWTEVDIPRYEGSNETKKETWCHLSKQRWMDQLMKDCYLVW